MVKYDEIFKYIVGNFPRALAALALNMPEVVVGESVSTEQPTVQTHRSDMAFHIYLPGGEKAILHIEAQTDDSIRKPMPLRMLLYSSLLAHEYEKNVYSAVLYFVPLRDGTIRASTGMETNNWAASGSNIKSSGCMTWKARTFWIPKLSGYCHSRH